MNNEQLIASYKVSGDKKLRDEIVTRNIGLVYAVAKRKAFRHTFDDAVSEGLIALVQSVDKFSVENGVAFTTFATTVIMNAIRMMNRTNRNQTKRIDGFKQQFSPNSQEFQSFVQQSDEIINIQQMLKKANLTERERTVIAHRYGIDCERLTLVELSKRLDISVARCQQIEVEVLNNLRNIIK